MRCKPNMLGGAAVAAAAGALMLAAATPSLAAPYSPSAQHQMTPHSAPTRTTSMPGMAARPATGSATRASMSEPLNKVSNPKTTLASAQVEDREGHTVGHVRSVMTGSSGKVSKIEVSLTQPGNNAKAVSIKASKLRYEPQRHMVKAELTRAQINAMPKASSMQNP